MYMSRDIMHCKPGKAKELVEKFKKFGSLLQKKGMHTPRIYTDVSGDNYWTVVIETDIDDIDSLVDMSRNPAAADPEAGNALQGYHDLVVEGRREFFKLE